MTIFVRNLRQSKTYKDYVRCNIYFIGRNESLSLYRQILAAAGAGTCQITVTVPMELLIIRKVTSTNQSKFSVEFYLKS